MDSKVIGDRIRRLREDAHITKRFLAKEIGVSYSAMCKYESGLFIPADDVKIRIANYFCVTVQNLFFDAE